MQIFTEKKDFYSMIVIVCLTLFLGFYSIYLMIEKQNIFEDEMRSDIQETAVKIKLLSDRVN